MKHKFTKMTVERNYLVTWQEAENILSNEDFQKRLENGNINCSLKRDIDGDSKLYQLTFIGALYSIHKENTIYTSESIATDLNIVCEFAEKIISGAKT